MTSEETQYRVDLLAPPLFENSSYAIWQLSKEGLLTTIQRLQVVPVSRTWKQIRKGRAPSHRNYHPTAVAQTTTPVPIARALLQLGRYSKRHRVLYHGVGRDTFGAEALTRQGRYKVVRYDPFHPDTKVRRFPRGRYREVWSIYTLNVLSFERGMRVLTEIYNFIDELEHKPETAFTMIAVRRYNH